MTTWNTIFIYNEKHYCMFSLILFFRSFIGKDISRYIIVTLPSGLTKLSHCIIKYYILYLLCITVFHLSSFTQIEQQKTKTTRAIHLDLALSLASDDFLNVLWRFVAVYMTPETINSYNGNNFVGAKKEHSFVQLKSMNCQKKEVKRKE